MSGIFRRYGNPTLGSFLIFAKDFLPVLQNEEIKSG